MTSIVYLGVVILSLLVGAFTVLAEAALTRTTRVRAHHLAQERRFGCRALVRIVEDPAPYMNATVMLRIVAYTVAVAFATAFAVRYLDSSGELVAIGVMAAAIFVVAEIVPRSYAVQKTDRAALVSASVISLVGTALSPVARLLLLLANALMVILPGRPMRKGPFVTDEEMRQEGDPVEDEQLEEEEAELIHSVFEFGDTVVREVMVPRPDMVTIPAEATLQEALETITKAGYSRIPIYEGDTDNIIGVLYAKDLLRRSHELRSERKVRALGRAPLFVPEQKKVAELLREMQQQRVHMAIVVDEYGGTAGLVTIEDLIEEIVGEIVDEYDQEEPLVEPIDDETIRVDAKMPIDEVNELLDVELPHEEWDTVGGLVFGLTGRVPVAGETVRYDSLEFRTERVTGRRIQKVVISKVPVPDEQPSLE
jgi:CBS domain containing-hemolysin-like protein